ncbi:MAG: hypothetical protein WCS70_15900 [Verrucomicrobiota bacterium]
MKKSSYGVLIGVACALLVTGIGLLYWKLPAVEADWWTLAWVAGWVVLFWPILYYCVWRVRVKLTK